MRHWLLLRFALTGCPAAPTCFACSGFSPLPSTATRASSRLRKEGRDKEAIMYDDIADSISGLLRIVAEDHQGLFGVDVRVEEGSTEDGK